MTSHDECQQVTTSPDMSLSIVITSYTMERFKDICELFDSIKAQAYPNIEIIFVAEQSEELASAVEKYLKSNAFSNFKVLINKGKVGVNICRNMGIEASSGEIVGLVDDDVTLLPHWAEETVKNYLDDDAVVAVTGPAIPLWEDPRRMSWFPKELYFVWGCTVWDWDEKREIRNVGGMNCSFQREALFAVGLYRPDIGPKGGEEIIKWFYPSGEEIELSLKIRRATGKRIIYDPKVKVYHKVAEARFNLGFVAKRAFRFGYTKQFIKHMFRNDFSKEKVLGMEFSHLRHIALSSLPSLMRGFLKSPVLAWRKLFVILIGVLFTGLGYASYILKPYQPQKEWKNDNSG